MTGLRSAVTAKWGGGDLMAIACLIFLFVILREPGR